MITHNERKGGYLQGENDYYLDCRKPKLLENMPVECGNLVLVEVRLR